MIVLLAATPVRRGGGAVVAIPRRRSKPTYNRSE
jgi:hypothetical protein